MPNKRRTGFTSSSCIILLFPSFFFRLEIDANKRKAFPKRTVPLFLNERKVLIRQVLLWNSLIYAKAIEWKRCAEKKEYTFSRWERFFRRKVNSSFRRIAESSRRNFLRHSNLAKRLSEKHCHSLSIRFLYNWWRKEELYFVKAIRRKLEVCFYPAPVVFLSKAWFEKELLFHFFAKKLLELLFAFTSPFLL